MRPRLTWLLIGCVALVSCNPVDDGPSASEQFASATQQHCAFTAARIAKLGPLPTKTPEATATYVESTVRMERELLSTLRRQKPPPPRQAAIESWLDDVDAALGAQTKVVEALRSSNASAIDATIRASTEAATRADHAARKLGFEKCATPTPARRRPSQPVAASFAS